LKVIYPKNFGNWVQVTLKVTVGGSNGTESSVYRTFWLPALVDDLKDEAVIPPGAFVATPAGNPVGPYGYIADCQNPD